MTDSEDLGRGLDAAALGESVLTQIVEGTADGIFLCDAERRWVYVNPAACRMLGRPAPDLIGHDYVDVVPARDKDAARQYYGALLEGSTEMLTRMLIAADGQEREMVFAPFRIEVDGRPHGAALFRDFTESRAAGRAAAALAQSAAELVGDASANQVLAGIARHAVESTRATWAGIAVVGETDTFALAGAYGPDGADYGDTSESYRALRTAPAKRFLDAMTAGALRTGDVPSRAVTLTRSTWEQDPVLSTYGRTVLHHDWRSAVSVPLSYDNSVNGALMVLLPSGITTLTDAELTFCLALADHATMAVANNRLAREAERTAELRERGRVARELHDSVSQALFAMTMHARTAQLALRGAEPDPPEPLARSLEQLSQLSRGTLAEMRTLIFELRPEALADEGLVMALTTQAAAISVRQHVAITVDGPPGRLPIGVEVEAEIYQIVSEVLRNGAKHASAQAARVTVGVEHDDLTVTVVGVGGTPIIAPTRRLDAFSADRARTVGAALTVRVDEQGTVSIIVPLHAPADRDAAHP